MLKFNFSVTKATPPSFLKRKRCKALFNFSEKE